MLFSHSVAVLLTSWSDKLEKRAGIPVWDGHRRILNGARYKKTLEAHTMSDSKERLTASVSDAELQRRWKLAREVMGEHEVDYLLMRADEEFLGGYVRWFSDFPARHSYPLTVIFAADDEMTLIAVGPWPPGDPFPPEWAVRGVKQRLSAPYFPSVRYTSSYDAELAARVLGERRGAAVGIVGRSFIPVNFHEHLVNRLRGCKFVEMTDAVDRIKAVKSKEEIGWIQKTAAIQDAAIEQVRHIIKPGLHDFEVMAEAQYATAKNGSGRQLILVASGPKGVPVPFQPRHMQNRVIREGDQVSVLIEVNGPAGYYTEIGRIFSLGEPSQELRDAFGFAVQAQQHCREIICPGASPEEILQAVNGFTTSRGYGAELRLFAHGQGYDLA